MHTLDYTTLKELGMQFDSLHMAVTVPIIGVVGLIIFFSMFPTMIGGFNESYLHSQAACVYNSERFDRVSASADDWSSPVVLSGSGDNCTGAVSGTPTEFYTPRGTALLTSDANIAVAATTLTITGDATDSGRGWASATGVIEQQGGLNRTLLSILGLGLPVGSMALIIGFGGYFARRIGSQEGIVGMILSVVGSVISIILLATMLGVFLPNLDTAFNALDSSRYTIFSGGIGSIATLIGNFWATLLVASVIVIGFQVVRNFSAMKGEFASS